MAPEYLHKGLISKKAYIFSLGVIIIEILTGCREYPQSTETDMQQFVEKVDELTELLHVRTIPLAHSYAY